jgi:CHAD domain-containing protein
MLRPPRPRRDIPDQAGCGDGQHAAPFFSKGKLRNKEMAYRLKAGEAVAEGIKRIVLEEIDSATRLLDEASGHRRDSAIHEARKSVKKIRGVLRLIRPELGRAYRDENARFRELGHHLSELRDSAALLEVFNQVAKESAGTLEKKSISAIRAGLQKEKRATEQRLDAGKVVKTASAAFRSLAPRARHWPLTHNGFQAIDSGLESTYRLGRKALKRAEKTEKSVAFHDFRKRVKDHWYHVRLLESLWTEIMEAHESSLKQLETWLGDDHNLVLLSEKLQNKPEDFGGEAPVSAFIALVDQHQKELRGNSISLGRRVYAEKPSVFVGNLGQLWDVWREHGSEPDPTDKARTGKRSKGSV